MDTPGSRNHLYGNCDHEHSDGVLPLVPAADEVVNDAEAIACLVWVELLRERRSEMESAVRTAIVRLGVARRRLSAAQRGGDLRQIFIARSRMERDLEAASTATRALDQIRHAYVVESDFAARAAAARDTKATSGPMEHAAPEATGPPEPTVEARQRDVRPAPTVAGASRRLPRWVRHDLRHRSSERWSR